MTTPRPDALTANPLLLDALEFAHQGALVGLIHTAPDWRQCEFFPCNAYEAIERAARADAEREVAALRAIVARYKVPLPLLRAAIENVRPYAGFHDDVRVITAADAFADILGALAKEEGS